MKKLLNIVLVIVVIVASIYGFKLYKELPLEYKDFSIISQNRLPVYVNASSSLVQFSQNMRFANNQLSYFIDSSCSLERVENMEKVFNLLSEKTEVIYFYEDSGLREDTNILVYCSEETKPKEGDSEGRVLFIAGEGGPRRYLELNPYPLILQGEIQLYGNRYSKKCSEPLVELHELLHVLGFDHLNDTKSVLYPYLSCDQELKEEIVDAIKELYSSPPKVELFIENLSASKAGKYMDFYVEITNTGLIDAKNIVLKISSDKDSIGEFEVENIAPGVMRSIDTKNFKLKSVNTENIIFEVVSSNEEYSLENNKVELVL